MSGAELVTVLGVAASVIQIYGFCVRIIKVAQAHRQNEFLQHLEPQVAVLEHVMRQLRKLDLESSPHKILGRVLDGCMRQVANLSSLVDEYHEILTTLRKRVFQALKIPKLEREIQKTWALIDNYQSTISFHLTVHSTLLSLARPDSSGTEYTIFSVPLPRDPHFVGRQDMFDTFSRIVRSSSTKRCIISLVGRPGIGKTSFARELCYRMNHKYAVIAWIQSSHHIAVTGDMEDLASTLSGGHKTFDTRAEIFAFVRTAAQKRTGPWLFVLDDCTSGDVKSEIVSLIADGDQPDVILATQTTSDGIGKEIKALPMSEEDGVNMLLSRSLYPKDKKEIVAAKAIVHSIGYTPYDITTVIAMANSAGKPISEFARLLETVMATNPSNAEPSLDNISQVSLGFLQQENPMLLDFLLQLSVLDPRGVPESLFFEYYSANLNRDDLAPYYQLLIQEGKWSSEKYIAIAVRLGASEFTGLMFSDFSYPMITMGRVPLSAVRRFSGRERCLQSIFEGFYMLSTSISGQDWETFSYMQRRILASNTESCMTCCRDATITKADLKSHAGILEQHQTTLVSFLAFSALSDHVESYLYEIFGLQLQSLGESSVLTCTTIESIANLHLDEMSLDQAQIYVDKYINVTSLTADTETALRHDGLLLESQLRMRKNELEEAMKGFHQYTQHYADMDDASYMRVAHSLMCGAEVLLMQGRLEEATQNIYDAQCIEREAGRSRSLAIRIDWALARLSALNGDYVRAINRYKDLVEDCREHYKPSHPRALAFFCELGDVYRELGDSESAEEYYTKGDASEERRARILCVEPQDISQWLSYGSLKRIRALEAQMKTE